MVICLRAGTGKVIMIIEDEDGNKWYVGEGDPAWPLTKVLAQFSYVVLPLQTIQGLRVPPVDHAETLVRLGAAYKETKDPDLRRPLLRGVRMYDCLLALERSTRYHHR